MDREKFQKKSNDDDDDNDNSDDKDHDNDADVDGVNGCEVGRGESLIKKHKKHPSTIEGDTSRKKQKSTIAPAQANEDGYFWNEGAELWTDGDMKFSGREAIPSVNAKDPVKYKYVE